MRREELAGLPVAAQKYCDYLLVVRSRSQLTVLEYASDLRTFFRWLVQKRRLAEEDTEWEKLPITILTERDLGAVTLYECYEFLTYCAVTLKNSSKTRARKVVALRRFYRYLETQNLLPRNPLEHLEAPTAAKNSLPRYLTLEESRELLAAIDGRHRERNIAIITLFLHCGLRLAELVGINTADIKDDRLTVRGKGNKERVVYLNEACMRALDGYLPLRNAAVETQREKIRIAEEKAKYSAELEGEKPTSAAKNKKQALQKKSKSISPDTKDALFLSSHIKRICRRTVQHIVYQFLERAGLAEPGMSAHKLRHTAATLLYQHSGVDVRVLQELLGHENLGTTQIYTHVSSEQLRDAQGKNPLN